MDLGGGVEEECGHGGRGGKASPLSIPLRCQRGGRAGARLYSDVARGTGEDDRARTGPLSRFGSKARGEGESPFTSSFWFFNVF